MKNLFWIVAVLLAALLFWLYKKKKISGKKAKWITIVFFTVKGTISTLLFFYAGSALWNSGSKKESTEYSLQAEESRNDEITTETEVKEALCDKENTDTQNTEDEEGSN